MRGRWAAEAKKLESKLGSTTSKINMAQRMLKDLDAAEVLHTKTK